jgi:hypothetical protein
MGCIFYTRRSQTSDEDAEQNVLMAIVFNYHNLTLFPLFDIFRAMTIELMNGKTKKCSEDEKSFTVRLLKELDHDIRTMNDLRNAIIHGTWHIGTIDDDDMIKFNIDPKEIRMRKLKATKQGLSSTQPVKSVDDLKRHIAECERLKKYIGAISGGLSFKPDINMIINYKAHGITLKKQKAV